MYLGNVIDNKCRVREYYDIDGRGYYMGERFSDKSDFEYLNLLNDNGIIWTHKSNVPEYSKRRVILNKNSYNPDDEVNHSICKVGSRIGQVYSYDSTLQSNYCVLADEPYSKRFTYTDFDVLYQAGKEP